MAKSEREGSPEPVRLSALDRALQKALGEGLVFGLPSDPARTQFPALWDWLSRAYVGRDSLKQPATLTIRLGPEGVIASLTDRDLSASLDVGCAHLGDVFSHLEQTLQGPNPPIRNWGKKEPKLRKRKSGN